MKKALETNFIENRLDDVVRMVVNNEEVQKVTNCEFKGCITASVEYDSDLERDFLVEIYESNPYDKNSHVMVWVQVEKTKSFCTISHLQSLDARLIDSCFVKHEKLMPQKEGKILVGVHWNSHRKCWSVVNMKSRKTVGLLNTHMQTLVLSDISFKVDLSKKRKALEFGKKDRHTFIVGYLENNFDVFDCSKINYNVNNNEEPFNLDGESIIGESVYFGNDGKVYLID